MDAHASKSKLLAAHLILVVVAMPLIVSGFRAFGFKSREVGIVAVDNLNVLSEPSQHGFLQKRLAKGTQVEIIKHQQGWLQILHAGEVGFILDEAHLVRIIRQEKTNREKDEAGQNQKSASQIDVLEAQQAEILQEIEKGESEVQQFSQKEIKIIDSLNEAERALNKSRQRLSALKSEITQIENKISVTTRESTDLKKQIKNNEQYVAKRLVALYKLNQLGQIQLLASADTIYDSFQRKAALEKILTYDQKCRDRLEEDRLRLNRVLTGLKKHNYEKRVLLAEYDKQQERMSRERSKRAELLAEIRDQKSLKLAAIESLKQSANDLERELKKLTQEPPSGSNDKNTPQKSIENYKGLLKMPVEGNIITLYGPYKNKRFNVLNFRSGIDIQAEKGEPVRAVYGGRVVYADWFKGYGNMIIIDHGANFHTVYAHVEDIFKSKGDTVETGEVIATVGDTGSITGPKLHFEVRHHGKSLDPSIWLSKG